MINNCLSFLNLFLVSSYYKFILFKINSYVQMSPISLNFGILKSYLLNDRFIFIKWTFCTILAFISSNSSFRNTNDIFYLFLTLSQNFLIILFLHESIVNFKTFFFKFYFNYFKFKCFNNSSNLKLIEIIFSISLILNIKSNN